MRKKVTVALALLSAVVLAVGIWNYLTLFLLPAQSYWDARVGTDAPLFSLLGAVFAALGFVVVVRWYLGAILLIWAVYGAALLVLRAVRRRRRRGETRDTSAAGPS